MSKCKGHAASTLRLWTRKLQNLCVKTGARNRERSLTLKSSPRQNLPTAFLREIRSAQPAFDPPESRPDPAARPPALPNRPGMPIATPLKPAFRSGSGRPPGRRARPGRRAGPMPGTARAPLSNYLTSWQPSKKNGRPGPARQLGIRAALDAASSGSARRGPDPSACAKLKGGFLPFAHCRQQCRPRRRTRNTPPRLAKRTYILDSKTPISGQRRGSSKRASVNPGAQFQRKNGRPAKNKASG
jgi:hypothetical protein